jgi:thioester reductase-like protein
MLSPPLQGKVLVEKLLRSTEVAVVYLLIRPRKTQTAAERMQTEVNFAHVSTPITGWLTISSLQ